MERGRCPWEVTDLEVDDEETGAPVYSGATRTIVGIARGKLDGIYYVIPLQLAGPLLLPLSVSGDEEKLGEIEKQFHWSVIPAFRPDDKVRLRLCYDKFIPTTLNPTIASITTTISYYDKNGTWQQKNGTGKQPLVEALSRQSRHPADPVPIATAKATLTCRISQRTLTRISELRVPTTR